MKGRPIKKRDLQTYGYNLYQHYKALEESKNLATATGFMVITWLDKLAAFFIQWDDFPNAKRQIKFKKKTMLSFLRIISRQKQGKMLTNLFRH